MENREWMLDPSKRSEERLKMEHFGAHIYLQYITIFVSIIIFGWSLSSKYNEINKNRDAGKHHLLPKLLNLMMLLMESFYASPMISYGSLQAMFISIVESILLMNYINKLIEVSGTKRRKRRQIFMYFFPLAIALITILGYLLMKIQNYSKRHFLAGLLYTASTMAASLSCYTDMKLAWTKETAKHLSVFWIIAMLSNAICWCTYGLIPFDKFTLLPNLYGLIMAVAQLITYAHFRNSNMSPRRIPSNHEGDG